VNGQVEVWTARKYSSIKFHDEHSLPTHPRQMPPRVDAPLGRDVNEGS
jgi:hypothetical protein